MSAKDLSGHGRDGTYSAGVTFGVPGVIAGDTAAHYAIGKVSDPLAAPIGCRITMAEPLHPAPA